MVYDGAHAFGTKSTASPPTYGDATMFSFHATKLFHTAEGALAVNTPELKQHIDLLKTSASRTKTKSPCPASTAR